MYLTRDRFQYRRPLTRSLGFGHPSGYEPRSTELNFGEQTGIGVFQREQSASVCCISNDEHFSSKFSKKVFFAFQII